MSERRSMLWGDFNQLHVAFICGALVLSAFAGRQIFMDGSNYVLQSLIDVSWFPMEPPRRLFSVLWTTALIRLLGLIAPEQIGLAVILFGIFTYAQIVIPLAVLAQSKLNPPLKNFTALLFLSGTIFLANFAASEILFLIALTTVFAVYTMDDEADRTGIKRLIAAILLAASYETAFVISLVLASGSLAQMRRQRNSRLMQSLIVGVLIISTPLQIFTYFVTTGPQASGVMHWFVFAIAGAFLSLIVGGLVLFSVLARQELLSRALVVAAFVIPVMLLLCSEALGIRTRLFQFSYPSRIYTHIVALLIAGLPSVFYIGLLDMPKRISKDIKSNALQKLTLAYIAVFVGVSITTSVDAYHFRRELESQFSKLAGPTTFASCEFCQDPQALGFANLGYPWVWPMYSMIYSMHRPDNPSLVVYGPDGPTSSAKWLMARFESRRRAGL